MSVTKDPMLDFLARGERVTKATVVACRDHAMRRKVGASPEALPTINAQLSLMRQLVAALEEEETAGKTRKELSADDVLTRLKAEHAKRMASAEIYREAGETDRAISEAHEAHVISGFLPVPASSKDVRAFLTRYLSNTEVPAGGAAIGACMKALKGEFADFDSRAASATIRELLQARA